jgi:hypothetical protein
VAGTICPTRPSAGYVLAGAGVRSGLAAGYLAGLLLVAWIAVELLILRSGRIVTGSRDQRP